MDEHILLILAIAFVLRGMYELRRQRLRRKKRDELRHVLGAPVWWGKR